MGAAHDGARVGAGVALVRPTLGATRPAEGAVPEAPIPENAIHENSIPENARIPIERCLHCPVNGPQLHPVDRR